ncbi:zinc finger protein 467 isoform 2 [Daubentonia madagascariensis]|uniref:Zinc finger protein 467 isoform 2 n=1 Tax=Daubentonia madagascariensis TaxID=31869 RepID=A0ABD2EF72_DAUMA
MRETLEALSSLGFSVGQPEMAPQSEPREGSHNAQEEMASSREENALGTCSGHEAPRLDEGAHTEQAEAPCRGGQVCTPQKAEPVGSCPVPRDPCRQTSWAAVGYFPSPRSPKSIPSSVVPGQGRCAEQSESLLGTV